MSLLHRRESIIVSTIETSNDKMRLIIPKRSDFILKIIKEGQRIEEGADIELLEDLITGGSRDICLKWRMDKFNFSIKDRTLAMIDILLDAFQKENK